MAADRPTRSFSGRATVAAFALAVLALWGSLEWAFRAWRADFEARATFGATAVAPTVDPLADLGPPGIPPEAWRQAVADTHAILLALTTSGWLDRPALETLQRRLTEQVAQAKAHPATAQAVLTTIWDDLARDAGPAITPDQGPPPPPGSRLASRHPRPQRPRLLGPLPPRLNR